MFMVKDHIQLYQRHNFIPDCELIWLELNWPKVLIGVMYGLPSSDEKDP